MMLAHDMTLLKTLPPVKGKYFENAPLANLIWFRTGGPAEVLFRPKDENDLKTFLEALAPEVPVTVIEAIFDVMRYRSSGSDHGSTGPVRLSGIFKRHGVHLPKQTMWDMLVRPSLSPGPRRRAG